jgi:4-carboxymuconolactone decarboxylase
MKLVAMTLASLSLLASSVAQGDPTKARDDARTVAPALEKYRQDLLFGDLWKRPGLNLRDRSIALVVEQARAIRVCCAETVLGAIMP